jgi:hypothetical protein
MFQQQRHHMREPRQFFGDIAGRKEYELGLRPLQPEELLRACEMVGPRTGSARDRCEGAGQIRGGEKLKPALQPVPIHEIGRRFDGVTQPGHSRYLELDGSSPSWSLWLLYHSRASSTSFSADAEIRTCQVTTRVCPQPLEHFTPWRAGTPVALELSESFIQNSFFSRCKYWTLH